MLLTVISVAVFLLLLEVGVRGLQLFELLPVLNRATFDSNAECATASDCGSDSVLVTSDNPVLYLELNPEHPSINSYGMRDREYAIDAEEDTRRIALMGDSVAYGYGVSLEDSVGKRLESMLNASPSTTGHYEVMNFGVSGYGTRAALEFFELSARQFEPDVVVVAYVMNDPLTTQALVPAVAEVIQKGNSFERICRYSQVLAWISLNWGRTIAGAQAMESYAPIYDPEGAAWRDVVASLRRFEEYSREDDFKLVVAIVPMLYDFDSYPFATYHEQVIETLEAQGIPYLDLLPEFRKHAAHELRLHDQDATHPNALGHRIAAERLLDFLQPYLPK